MKQLGDSQNFLIRNMAVCFVGLCVSVLVDCVRNLAHGLGLTSAPHPVSFGLYQISAALFFGFFLVISAIEFFLYYYPKDWE